jgi:hypothetical protein
VAANVLPGLILVGAIVVLLFNYIVVGEMPSLMHVLLPIYATAGTLVLLHILISVLLPVRWPVIKGDFRSRLGEKLSGELRQAFLPVPEEVTNDLTNERRQVTALGAETAEVAIWLAEREQAAHVAELYGAEAG